MDELARAAHDAFRALAEGQPEAALRRRLPPDVREEAVGLARARLKARDRFPHFDALFFDPMGLRYATPEAVAEARARRIAGAGDAVADLACGVGIQLAFLALHARSAVGVELAPRRAAYARRNVEALGARADVVEGDCLAPEVAAKVGAVDVVFCDPARAPESPERTFDDLSPDPRRVVGRYASCGAFAFELPPQMPPSRVQAVLDGEVEYTSLGFALNRACLYTGPLARASRSALSLPSGASIVAAEGLPAPPEAPRPGPFVHEIDPAVTAAGLVPELAARVPGLRLMPADDKRRVLATSEAPVADPFLRGHDVLDWATGTLSGLHERLRRLRAGKVTLRFAVDPAEYWSARRRLEEGLEGALRVHLFRVGDHWLVTSPRAASIEADEA